MKPFNFWRFLLTAALFTILALIIHNLDALVAMDYYKDPLLAPIWSKIMMPEAGPPPVSFYYFSIAFTFASALLFVLVYAILKHAMPGKNLAGKGAIYGLLMFAVAGIPMTLSLILLFNLPLFLILLWAAEDFIIKLAGGVVVAAVNK